jgi:hypothetical protein
MTASETQLNGILVGFTEVAELCLSRNCSSGAYELRLTLGNACGEVVHLNCLDISNLAITEFGGGLTQFLVLRAEDVSNRQLDRVSLHFADLERHAIAFDCASAQVTKGG